MALGPIYDYFFFVDLISKLFGNTKRSHYSTEYLMRISKHWVSSFCDFYMLYNCDWNTNGKISRTRSFIFIEYVFVCVCAMFSRHNVFSYSEPESISMALGSSIICFVDGRNGPNNSAAWTQFLAIISHVCLLYSCNKQSKRKIWLRWTNNNDDFPRFVFGWCLKRIVLFESINEVCSHYANDYYQFNNFYLLSTA